MMKHFFISEHSGELFDTRVENWSSHPLRLNYQKHHRKIKTVEDLKATLRAGAYGWPGGYQMYFTTGCGGALSFKSARENFRNIADSIQTDCNDGWRVIGCDINYEDSNLYCDDSGERIPPAYGDDIPEKNDDIGKYGPLASEF